MLESRSAEQARAPNPMVPLKLFRSRTFSGANLLTLFLYSALGIFFFVFPMNLIQVQHYSATAAGAAALPLILLMFVLSRWPGGLVTRYGPKLPLIVGRETARADTAGMHPAAAGRAERVDVLLVHRLPPEAAAGA